MTEIWNDCPICHGALSKIYFATSGTYHLICNNKHYSISFFSDLGISTEYFYFSSPDGEVQYTGIRSSDVCGFTMTGRVGRYLGDINLPISTNTKYFISYENLMELLNLL